MERIDWQALRPTVFEAIEWLKGQGVPTTTIRTIYYRLGDDLKVIPLTEYGYKKIDELIVDMRKSGEIPWGFFSVERGKSIECTEFKTAEEYTQMRVDSLKKAHERYGLPRWYGQDVLVEVWIEKEGQLPLLWAWLRDLDVTLRAPKGYMTWEFARDSVRAIKERLERERDGRKVVVIYLGDLDPSGTDIDRCIQEAMEFFGVDFDFQRLALHPGQIREFSLPMWPERMDVIEKLERDPRRRKYFERFGRIACEIDSFVSRAPKELRTMIRAAVLEHFDREKTERTEAEEKRLKRRVRKLVRQAVEFKK